MFRTNTSRKFQPEVVNIEDLVPQDHLLRKINETIDFSFIAEKCRPLYCEDNGRPCVDPVMLFKMLLIVIYTEFARKDASLRKSG
jgi:transposase